PEVVGSGGPARLVWQMVLNAVDDPAVAESVLVDAHSGEIAFHYPLVYTALNRQIYDANNTANDPGTLVRSEGGAPVGLVDANNAYDYFGHTYAFYSSEHGRDSINNAGMTLSGTVRYCPEAPCPYANAFWSDSTNRMYFGEGYASADDVVAHELTHGVTSYESNLIYFNQSGAINESFSDMWGEWVDQTNGAGNDAPGVKWYMGEDLPIGAIRNMANPPEFGDPDRMGSPYYSANIADLGAVHWNSGVGNKLCYLLTDGDTFNGRTVTAMGIGSTADLFYECQANLLTSASDYMDLYVLLLQAANTFGYTQMQTNNLVEACLAVELGVQPNKLAVGDYAGYWGFPMYTLYHDSRTQSIYLASEIGRSGRITAVSLYVTTVPGQPLNNWTIRMKTTALSAFPAPASMDGTGWTVCYQANETVSSTGQRTFTFSTPFQYDGASNLMIDFSHNNTSYTTAGSCLAFVPGGYRSVYAYSDSTNGDPLTWSGTSSPSKTRSTAVPCVALTFSAASATVTNVSSVHANGSFTVGEVIDIDVTFAVPVSVTGTPRLELETGNINRMATYLSGSGGATLTFRYTVASGDTSPDLDYTNGGALRFNGGTIKDVSTQTLAVLTLPAPGASGSLGANRAIVIDTAAPTVSSVTSSLANGTYPVGQVVPVQVTFDEAVVYMAGTGVAQLQLETGVTDRQAPYAGGTGTAGLTFNYTVQPGDMSPDLEYFSTGALTLTGTATIKDVAGNNAVLTLPGLGTPASLGGSKDIVIDTTGPPGTVDAAASPQPDRDLPNWNDTEAEKMSVLKFRVSDQGVDGCPR
ncbi:MAG TPA: M4 family metallopeptidase, partial [Candidatus Hydrogenedentes bacterium]|nr:M4 family metallopeptidase [Candidatus Hydrogenedentota bacterium]